MKKQPFRDYSVFVTGSTLAAAIASIGMMVGNGNQQPDPFEETEQEIRLEEETGVEIITSLQGKEREQAINSYKSELEKTFKNWDKARIAYGNLSSVTLDPGFRFDGKNRMVTAELNHSTDNLWLYCGKQEDSYVCPDTSVLVHDLGHNFADDVRFASLDSIVSEKTSESYISPKNQEDCVQEMLQLGSPTCYGTERAEEAYVETLSLAASLQNPRSDRLNDNPVLASTNVHRTDKINYLHAIANGFAELKIDGLLSETEYVSALNTLKEHAQTLDGYQ